MTLAGFAIVVALGFLGMAGLAMFRATAEQQCAAVHLPQDDGKGR
ncbi:MAG: hypothetical protein VX871_04400 [Pseudomonadota bacterium]|nr:hypothetical protein [Pseudomonadota bacterium]